jgi:hypothetical protein
MLLSLPSSNCQHTAFRARRSAGSVVFYPEEQGIVPCVLLLPQ